MMTFFITVRCGRDYITSHSNLTETEALYVQETITKAGRFALIWPEQTPPKQKRYLPLLIAARIGDILPLTDGTQAEIVGKWEDKVMARRKGETSLIHVTGIHLED